MKKRTLLAIICTVLALMLAVPAAADTTGTTSLDDNLVIHWDFEGATAEEQLADKATAGVCEEDLVFQADKGTNNSTVSEGVLHLDSANGSAVERRRRDNIDPPTLCTDIETLTEGMTVYMKMKVSGTTTAGFSDVLDIGNVMRIFVTGVSPSVKVRFTSDAYSSNAHEVAINSILKDEFFYLAITTTYNSTTQKLDTVSYISFDGENYLDVAQSFEGVASFYSDAATNWKGFRFGLPCHFGDRNVIGTEFDFDDIRIYNKALSGDEIVSINAAPGTGEGEGEGEGEGSGGENVTEAPGNETEAPETNAPETNAPETEAGTTEAPADEKSGCGSAVGGVALIMMAPIAGLFAVSKKRKK